MSYYFVIVSPTDTPLFEHQFGTSKQGGDGIARFRLASHRHMNQLIAHAALDPATDLQWLSGAQYLRAVDASHGLHVSCFVTGSGVRFLLLHDPASPTLALGSGSGPGGGRGAAGTGVPANPTSPAAEEAVRLFLGEVYEAWLKAVMNPFQSVGGRIGSQVFRTRVAAAGKKHL